MRETEVLGAEPNVRPTLSANSLVRQLSREPAIPHPTPARRQWTELSGLCLS